MELYLKDRRGPQEHRERQALDNGQSLRETPLSLLYGVNGQLLIYHGCIVILCLLWSIIFLQVWRWIRRT